MIRLKSTGGIYNWFPDYIFSTQRVTRVVGNTATIDGVDFDLTSLKRVDDSQVQQGGGTTTTIINESSDITDLAYNGNRKIKRDGLPQFTPKTDTVKKFLDEVFYPFKKAEIKLTGGFHQKNAFYGRGEMKFWAYVNVSLNDYISQRKISTISIYEIESEEYYHSQIGVSPTAYIVSSLSLAEKDLKVLAEVQYSDGLKELSNELTLKYQYPVFTGVELNGKISDAILSLKSPEMNVNPQEFQRKQKVEIKPTSYPKKISIGFPVVSDYDGDTGSMKILDPNGFDVTHEFVPEFIDISSDCFVGLSDYVENKWTQYSLTFPVWTHFYKVFRAKKESLISGVYTVIFPILRY